MTKLEKDILIQIKKHFGINKFHKDQDVYYALIDKPPYQESLKHLITAIDKVIEMNPSCDYLDPIYDYGFKAYDNMITGWVSLKARRFYEPDRRSVTQEISFSLSAEYSSDTGKGSLTFALFIY